MTITARFLPGNREVAITLPEGTRTVPLARWPVEARDLGLGTWDGDGEAAGFTPMTPDAAATEFRPLPRKRLLFALLNLGFTEAQVLTAIAGLPVNLRETYRIEFAETVEFHRAHPFMVAMVAQMGIDPAEADGAWLAQQEGL